MKPKTIDDIWTTLNGGQKAQRKSKSRRKSRPFISIVKESGGYTVFRKYANEEDHGESGNYVKVASVDTVDNALKLVRDDVTEIMLQHSVFIKSSRDDEMWYEFTSFNSGRSFTVDYMMFPNVEEITF